MECNRVLPAITQKGNEGFDVENNADRSQRKLRHIIESVGGEREIGQAGCSVARNACDGLTQLPICCRLAAFLSQSR